MGASGVACEARAGVSQRSAARSTRGLMTRIRCVRKRKWVGVNLGGGLVLSILLRRSRDFRMLALKSAQAQVREVRGEGTMKSESSVNKVQPWPLRVTLVKSLAR